MKSRFSSIAPAADRAMEMIARWKCIAGGKNGSNAPGRWAVKRPGAGPKRLKVYATKRLEKSRVLAPVDHGGVISSAAVSARAR